MPTLIRGDFGLPVLPSPHAPKSGCNWCPRFAWWERFDENKDDYRRLGKLSEIQAQVLDRRNKYINHSEVWDPVDLLIVQTLPKFAPSNDSASGGGDKGFFESNLENIWPTGVRFTHGYSSLVRCQNPLKPKSSDVKVSDVASCGHQLVREIQARKPKVVLAVGGEVMSYLTGQSGVHLLTGRPLACVVPGLEWLQVVACVSPGYVFMNPHELQKFVDAVELAGQVATGEKDISLAGKDVGQYRVLSTADEVEAEVESIIADGGLLAFDTETGSLHPHIHDWRYPKLLCVSFSQREYDGVTIPVQHEESPFFVANQQMVDVQYRLRAEALRDLEAATARRKTKKPLKSELEAEARVQRCDERIKYYEWSMRDPERLEENRRVIAALCRVFMSPVEKVGQNWKFDARWIENTLGVFPNNIVGDTLLRHYVLDDRQGSHGLDKLAHQYTWMGGYDWKLEKYKQENPECKESYANIPADILFPYAAGDTDVTLRVYKRMAEEQEYRTSRKVQTLDRFLNRLQHTLAGMEINGATVRRGLVESLDAYYSSEIASVSEKLNNHAAVRRWLANEIVRLKATRKKPVTAEEAASLRFVPSKTKQLQTVLFEYLGFRPVELSDTGLQALSDMFDILVEGFINKGYSPEEARDKVDFNDLINKAIAERRWDWFSTKADVLHEIVKRGAGEVKVIDDIIAFREAAILHGTFIEPLLQRLDSESRVHGSFRPTGTATGRLASSDPNLQNIPNKGAGAVKCCYSSRFKNGLILSADYSQVELRVAAAYFQEETMLEAYRNGIDLHALTAAAIAPGSPSLEEFKTWPKDEQKKWRTRAKRINFGVLYGGGPNALMATLKKDGVDITFDEAKDLIEKFFAARPSLKRGIERLQEEVKRSGKLQAFTGYTRRVPQVFSAQNQLISRALRQIVNFPIQHIAAYFTLMSLVLIDEWLKENNMRSVLTITVHDSILLDCPAEEVASVAKQLKFFMENLPTESEKVFPGLDWSWLNVPIVADMDLGPTWGQSFTFDPDQWGNMEMLGEPLVGVDEKGEPVQKRTPVTRGEVARMVKWVNATKSVDKYGAAA